MGRPVVARDTGTNASPNGLQCSNSSPLKYWY